MPSSAANPYSYDAPITDPARFFGRTRMIDFCHQTVIRNECVSIVGMAKAGLSSLLHRLAEPDFVARCEIPGRNVLVIPVDCCSYPDPLDLILYLLGQIAPEHPIPKVPNWRPAFGRFLSLTRRMRDKKLVVLFDDFEPMGASEHYVEFIESFRGLAIAADITLVTATHTELHRCCHKKVSTSPFPNIFKVRYLGAFREEEARTFLAETSQRSGVDLLPYAEQILELSGGMPYLVQMACWHYYEALAAGAAVDPAQIAALVADKALDALESAWNSLDKRDRELIDALVDGRSVGQAPPSLTYKGFISEDRVFSPAFADIVRAHR